MKSLEARRILLKEHGVTLVIIALLIFGFVAVTAMAVDIAHLYVVRNELHNASDAGALAGARCLYDCMGSGVTPGSTVNINANQFAFDAATTNNSDRVMVEVNSPLSNSGDVQRGHWSFSTKTFTPNASLTPPSLWNTANSVLDSDPNFINAVRVKTRRDSTQAKSFFAKVLGFAGFSVTAESVAYLGFAGKINPQEVDQPIAICKQSIMDLSGNYTCNVGRMSNSGGNAATHNTSAWSNFTQDPCEQANPPSVNPLICSTGNPQPIIFGMGIGATGGEISNLHDALRTCFGPSTRTTPWNMTLPVIDCPGNNPGNCATVLGAVNLDILWISDKASNTEKELEKEDFPPVSMGPTAKGTWYPTAGNTRVQNWSSFVSFFNLQTVDGNAATYETRTIYFLPSCSVHEPTGVSGGQNYGILAKIPVLVK